jgi:hypothetical protein
MLTVDYDDVRGLVRLSDKGFYSPQDEAIAASAARPALAMCRATTGDLKLLVICDAQVQKPEVMEAAAKRSMGLHGRDRAAYVFPTSLAKMQGSRFFNGPNTKCFLSENAAVTWLLAEREGR